MEGKIQKAVKEYADKHFIDDVEGLLNKPWPEAKELYKKMLADFAGEMLSGDLCLVEKEAVRKEYQQAIEQGKHAHVRCHVESRAKLRLLESLFPEIAKEVEDEKR